MCSERCQLAIGACRIICFNLCRGLCCCTPPAPRPEYHVVCLGMSGAGKTTLLTLLQNGETTDDMEPTSGFNIKAIQFEEAILNVKEVGGAENIRPYWDRYYQHTQGVVFVMDSACSQEALQTVGSLLHGILSHESLRGLPFVLLASHQDKTETRSSEQLTKDLELEKLCAGRKWAVHPCSREDQGAVRQALEQFITFLFNTGKESEENRV
ncbi:ADP-ribosylation factor-like protein 15 [Branchiostoma floridae]|uniref:ADP-ribosylation factor-like protein 15 n=1 Tax=Branchiostoma floridae TaxID=7739 RepID=A0A9J7KPL2_BRAFL|nr:ADP-ribosylation factor-like protein 15 [Branchiostoma floridae]